MTTNSNPTRSAKTVAAEALGMEDFLNHCPLCERNPASPYSAWYKNRTSENARAFADFLRSKLNVLPAAQKPWSHNLAFGRLLDLGYSPNAASDVILKLQLVFNEASGAFDFEQTLIDARLEPDMREEVERFDFTKIPR